MKTRVIATLITCGLVAFACGPRTRTSESTAKTVTVRHKRAPLSAPLVAKLGIDVGDSDDREVKFDLAVTNASAKGVEIDFPNAMTHDFPVVDAWGRVAGLPGLVLPHLGHRDGTELAHAALKLARGQIRVLQRNSTQAGEARRMRAHDLGDVIVEPAGKIEPIRRLRPIAEHHRDGRKHLHRDACAITFFQSAQWIPGVVADLAKETIADHHSRTTWSVVVEPDESRIAVLGVEIGPVVREDVGMKVDFHRCSGERTVRHRPEAADPAASATGCGLSIRMA